MSERYYTMDNAKNQTFGVEVEMSGIFRYVAARAVAKYFGTNDARDTSSYHGYSTWSCTDRKGRTWKFSKDSSIYADSDAKQCEMITPILTYDDIEDLQEIVRILRKKGAKSSAHYDCGVHIHIGADGHTAKSLTALANLMHNHQDVIYDVIGVADARKYRWCKPVEMEFINRINAERPSTMDEMSNIWYETNGQSWSRTAHYNATRYHMLNYHATFTKGTIEFRCFQFSESTEERKGGLHAGELKAYIQLCLAFSQKAKELKRIPVLRTAETYMNNHRDRMRNILWCLGITGEEYSNTMYNLTKRLGNHRLDSTESA